MEISQKQNKLQAECATSKQGNSNEIGVNMYSFVRGGSHMTHFAPVADDEHVACIPTLVG